MKQSIFQLLILGLWLLFAPALTLAEGTVASVHPLATRAGEQILAQGGNALDAAVATAFSLGVVDSHNSGIGGGCFILAHRADGVVLALDGREIAPAAATEGMYRKGGVVQKEWSRTGPLAIGVPGSLAAFDNLLRWGGTKSLKETLQPAIGLAEDGFPLGATLARRIKATRDKLHKFPATAAIFLTSEGQPLQQGTLLRQPDLANSLKAIAEKGSAWFYKGAFPQKAVPWLKSQGGILSLEDFSNYRVRIRQPIRSQVFGHTLIGFPPPSSGGTHVHQILTMVEQHPHIASIRKDPAALAHLFIEASKRAFADRARWLGDPDFTKIPPHLLERNRLSQRSRTILPGRASGSDIQPSAPEEPLRGHTTHITVADSQGNWVAITTTLNTSFGSGMLVPGTGILLNNQMDDFSAAPGQPNSFGLVGSQANAIAPGKRPLSSMSPTLVLREGKPVLALGAAGGPTIISQVSWALLQVFLNGASLEEAIAAPRLHHQWKPDLVFFENTLPQPLRTQLEQWGHRMRQRSTLGVSTGVVQNSQGQLLPVVDPRLLEQADTPNR